MQHYVNTELRYHAITGPFRNNPFPQPLICSSLQTVPKHGSSKRRVVTDLTFPPPRFSEHWYSGLSQQALQTSPPRD